jgi:hypothetical protein
MADVAPTSLEILIDIRAKLDALTQTTDGLKHIAHDAKEAHESASELGRLFMSGLGIGTGMQLAERAVDLFRESFSEAVRLSSQLAAEIERAHGRLGLQGEAYQTLASEARSAGTDFQEMTSSMAQFRQRLGDALIDPQQGTILRQLGLDAQKLASGPLERAVESAAVALGKVTDANVRARLAQELFGRGSAAMLPLLEKLRTEGYDKLRDAAKETNAVLGDDTAEALNKASTQAEEAQKRFGIALAPLNLKLIQAKTELVNFLAKNAGVIESGVEAGFAGSLAAGVEKALEKLEKSGGIEKAFENLGKTMAGPFGVGLATALGAFVIKELQRRAEEELSRIDQFDEAAHATPRDLRNQFKAAASPEDLLAVQNKTATEYNRVLEERNKLLAAGDLNDEQAANLRSLEQEYSWLSKLMTAIREHGAAVVTANQAAKDSTNEVLAVDAKLAAMEQVLKNVNERTDISPEEKRLTRIGAYSVALDAVNQQIDRYKETLQKLGRTELEVQKMLSLDPEFQKLIARWEALNTEANNAIAPPSQKRQINDSFRAFSRGEEDNGAKRLTVAQGPAAGAEQWAMSLGTQGEQVAQAMQSTLGATVQGISQGIYGWITGAESFGDVLRNLGGTILQTMLQTIVQMGVQWLVVSAIAKLGMLSTFALGTSLRKAETTDVIANETAKTPSIMTNAAGASVSSFGIAAALGLAALLAVMVAFGGFREKGGEARAGRAYIVGEKRPEVFVPDENGTILPSLDSLPVPQAASSRSVASAPSVDTSSIASGTRATSRASDQQHVFFFDVDAMNRYMESHMEAVAHNVFDQRSRA